jgi:hypothetical protein
MERLNEKHALERVVEQLKSMIGGSVDNIQHEHLVDRDKNGYRPDLIVGVGGFRFAVEYKSKSDVGVIANVIKQLEHYEQFSSENIPLIAVPYMSEAGKNKCTEANISWVDLSGNADVSAYCLRLFVQGEKNKFKKPGRKENPFSPKSSRIARRLLLRPEESLTQRELTEMTGLSEGLVSRVVRELEKQFLLSRDNSNRLEVVDPSLLLDAWVQGYDFSKHDLVRGHVAGRSGEEVLRKVSTAFSNGHVEHAATGLAAAWQYSHFAGFRLSSFYLREWPDDQVLEAVGFREVEKGENVWLLLPKDENIFLDVKKVDEIPCVHPIQAWLDLKSHPERAEEAAEELRHQLNF